jgi:chemotaxis protein methyltransferase CheR
LIETNRCAGAPGLRLGAGARHPLNEAHQGLSCEPVNVSDCTAFLQWALPQMNLRWPGFRKVRYQVCKRLARRIRELQLADFAAYRARLQADPSEWRIVDACCHITISRFFRDRGVFEVLRRCVLPQIASCAQAEARAARIWSAGCASGEEPYTLRILWDLEVASARPGVALEIVATDIDKAMIARARAGCFTPTSLRELPSRLLSQAFDRRGTSFCVKPRFRCGIDFLHQDLRLEAPVGPFDLVLCRYVAFTYFAPPLQEKTLARIVAQLRPGGYLTIGTHERLLDGGAGLSPVVRAPQIFRKSAAS